MPNAIHTAIIAVTNTLGHGIRVTNQFDTFSEDNLDYVRVLRGWEFQSDFPGFVLE